MFDLSLKDQILTPKETPRFRVATGLVIVQSPSDTNTTAEAQVKTNSPNTYIYYYYHHHHW